ncbi:MAG: prepilin-type N-terminal cleavage/methylation domain-containing protein [Phycisphaerales bacterium]|nr:prepilin-type N-terminal cleavage/methylation domain-containing protein [Phycisphaerales bacterium]
MIVVGNNNFHRVRRSAFTLIELLVVIAIIALLISILLPSLRSAREQAKLTKCLSSQRATAQAGLVFAGDHHNRIQLVTDEVGVSYADPSRNRFVYDENGELLAWPVAFAQGAGIGYSNNWNWGVRATDFDKASGKLNLISKELEMLVCPADKVNIATSFYPRYKNGNNNGLRGDGDPHDPQPPSQNMAYWGLLSFAINEDIAGAESAESNGNPACWRSVDSSSGPTECIGEGSYPDSHVCGGEQGRRLQGELDRVFRPGDVGLLFEAGRDDESSGGYANLIYSGGASGPYLADFEQRNPDRLARKRHPQSKMNVVFCDFHAETIRPVEFEPRNKLPTLYSPQTRVSPYAPIRRTR